MARDTKNDFFEICWHFCVSLKDKGHPLLKKKVNLSKSDVNH
jgi:hypothetical protein